MKRLAFALIPLLASAQNWPGFRGPNATGLPSGDAKPPVTFDGKEGKNMLWKVEIPGLAHASPIVWGDRVFIATAMVGRDPSDSDKTPFEAARKPSR